METQGFEISPQQKRLWLLQQKINNHPYFVYGSVLIKGQLNEEILEKALNQVISEHEIMRTSLTLIEGMNIPLQVINDKQILSKIQPSLAPEYTAKLTDFFQVRQADIKRSQKSEVRSQKSELNPLVSIKSEITFSLDDILEFQLIKINLDESILLINLSGFCADSISFFRLINQINDHYHTYQLNQKVINEPLQYADVAAWQNELLTGQDAESGKKYWKNNLDKLTFPKLSYEKTPPQKNIFTHQSISLNINSELFQKIKAIANNSQVSLSTVLLGCWQVLLWRLTEQSEIVLGWGCACRNYEELKPVLGLLIKYLPINNLLAENLKFVELLPQLESKINEAEQWQEYFTWEEFNSNQELLYLPFAFDFTSQPSNYDNGELSFTIQKLYSCLERFKVKLSFWERENELTAELYYDANLFRVEDIDRLAREFNTLLESAVNNPETAIARLEIISPTEREELLTKFNQTNREFADYNCIHNCFEAQVAKTPNQIAVVCEEEKLTYQELDHQANQVAEHLRLLGVKPNQIVALLVERSLDLAIGILGILKAGAAYLPLEANLPPEALTFRLEDAQVPVLLTQKHLVDKINDSTSKLEILCFEEIQENKVITSPTKVSRENLAYVIYTSGSTGKPKAVAVQHKQLINYLSSILEKLNLPPSANYATVSTFSADLGNTMIFSALCTGSTWHLLTENRVKDPIALADYCHRYPLDCLKIVPSHLSALLTFSEAAQFLPRQCLILGGEILTWELIEKVHPIAPECRIFNHYGPTETTIGVLTYPLDVNSIPSENRAKTVPLGRPLANTQIYLLDKYQQLVPLGVTGEIYIGGANVTKGYLNQPELTATKFIPNPFTPSENNLLYKTGDLARYLPDGNLEFLGRIDEQIKLHGFRIELGEIESVLRQHPQVRETVVVINDDNFNKKYLVAYVVPQEENINSLDVFRDFLQQKLPEYMVPSHFIQLKALPLTANGKIDRKNLPAPNTIKPELEKTFVSPRTPVEITLAQIWSELLGIDKIGINDNFFQLGGDSIISIQAIAKANQHGLRLTPKQIFEHQTIAKLAAVAEINNTFTSEQGLVTGKVPLTPIQKSFFAQDLPEPHHWNQSILLELRRAINPKQLQETIAHLLQHHDILRSQFPQDYNHPEAHITESLREIPFTKLDLSNLSEEKQKAAIEETATQVQTSLNLSEGPLLRVVQFHLGNDKSSRLLIVIHHLVIDGVSWRILLEDLQTALFQLTQGSSIQLPPKTTSFKQWVERLQEYGKTEKLTAELDYWCSVSTVKPLPVDYPDGVNTESVASNVSVFLNKTETQALLQEVPAVYRTQVNDILLAALAKAFSQWTRESQLLIDLEGHGREEIFPDLDLSRTVGWFTTVFPVLLDIEKADSPSDLLKTIKEQLRQIPHRGIGYGVLRYLNSDNALTQEEATMPSASVCFNYLGQYDRVLADSSWFKLASESDGVTRSPLGKRRYLFNINGYVIEEKLRLDWIYSSKIHQQKTVLTLAESFIQTLQAIISHCRSPEAGSYTPSDFPKANLNQQQLDQLLTKINRTSEKKVK